MTSAAAPEGASRKRRLMVGFDERGGAPLVKKEPAEDIKDYAETTMNELLGWYGYEKVDSRDTQGLNLTHFAASNGGSVSPPSSAVEGSDASEDGVTHHDAPARSDSVSPLPEGSDEVARQHQQMVSALSSIPKHPGAPDSPNLPPGCIVCAWCQKVGMKLFTLKTPGGCKAFCSELCFTQCRRASFKKNKICDWCKHVRHTVNYVDFQDGEQQLQFCSDKCLNQYKMNIFCKETQAHLQMHTHLKEAACKMASPSPALNLITPELWLRDCKANGGGLLSPPLASPPRSDDEVSVVASPPPPPPEPPRAPTPPPPPPPPPPPVASKERPRHASKGSSRQQRHSLKRAVSEVKHFLKQKERRLNGASPVRQVPVRLSPPPAPPGFVPMANGFRRRASPPPPLRPPYGVPPPPFHFLAQQQMETFMRSHPGMGGPPLPMPPWVVPPFPPRPPPPPAQPTSPPRSRHHHPPKKGRHKHSHKPAQLAPPRSLPPPPPPPPPVTVMVPFPFVLPLPLPVPVPIPIPPEVMERYRRSKLPADSPGASRSDSGSYSPADTPEDEGTVSPVHFPGFELRPTRSSPPSPTNLSVRDRLHLGDVSSNPLDFKKKPTHEKLGLVA